MERVKDLSVDSIVSLYRKKTQEQFRLLLCRQKSSNSKQEKLILQNIRSIDNKIRWEAQNGIDALRKNGLI